MGAPKSNLRSGTPAKAISLAWARMACNGPETRNPVPPASCQLARRASALALGLALAFAHGGVRAQGPGSDGGLAIDHDPPGCVAAGKYARLSACFRPEGAVARGRVYFRPQGTLDWFYVEMTGEPPCLEAVLPRPATDLRAIEYSISAVDRDLAEARTTEYTVPVTDSAACRAGPMAPVVESAAVVIGSTSGTEPVGFLTGEGLSTGQILGVVGGAAAVVAVAVLVAGGGEESPPTTTPPAATTSVAGSGRALSPTLTSSWQSELAVPSGRGQVVLDGAQAAWTGPGGAASSLSLGPGPHRLEAVLVEGKGQPGSWRFDLSRLGVVPGSLRPVAGAVARIGSDSVTFRLTGEPGERAVFTFCVGGS